MPALGRHPLREIRFAHPAEAEIARLFDFYDVQWQYEPTTFGLVSGEQGQSIQSFTPDFYLPDHDLYIEMTTMRQSLVTRKNRKFRLLRELYPELNVRLLYRRDVELILERSTAGDRHMMDRQPIRQVISQEQISRRTGELAEGLMEGSVPHACVLALGKGARRTRSLIAWTLSTGGSEITEGTLSVDEYRPDCRVGFVRLEGVELPALETADVIVVADVVATGLTALTAMRWLRDQGASRVRLISLLDRRSSRLVEVPLEAAGFTVTANWLVGAGLGGRADLRDLPDIHLVDASPAA